MLLERFEYPISHTFCTTSCLSCTSIPIHRYCTLLNPCGAKNECKQFAKTLWRFILIFNSTRCWRQLMAGGGREDVKAVRDFSRLITFRHFPNWHFAAVTLDDSVVCAFMRFSVLAVIKWISIFCFSGCRRKGVQNHFRFHIIGFNGAL